MDKRGGLIFPACRAKPGGGTERRAPAQLFQSAGVWMVDLAQCRSVRHLHQVCLGGGGAKERSARTFTEDTEKLYPLL